MTYQSVLDLALKEYGKAMVAVATGYSNGQNTKAEYDNMCFWQEQAYHAAKDVAKYGADTRVSE